MSGHSGHGGPRTPGPGKRIGRPPGIPNPGTGRPASKAIYHKGDEIIVNYYDADGTPNPRTGDLWTMIEVNSQVVTFRREDGGTVEVRMNKRAD